MVKPPNGHLRITDKTSCTNLSVIRRFHCILKHNGEKYKHQVSSGHCSALLEFLLCNHAGFKIVQDPFCKILCS